MPKHSGMPGTTAGLVALTGAGSFSKSEQFGMC
jgi:hypothetical protein